MKTTTILVLVAALAVPVLAMDTSTPRDMNGRTGLIFDFNGLNLAGFEGGVGVKTWLSSSLALVGGLEYYHGQTNADAVANISGYQTTSSEYGIFAALEHHLKVSRTISPYWGVSLSFGRYALDSTYFPPPIYGQLSSYNSDSFLYIEPRIFFGVELFLGDHLSFSGCYRLGVDYQWGTDHSESPDPLTQTMVVVDQKTSQTNWTLGALALRVTVYF